MKKHIIVATGATLMLGGCATLPPERQAQVSNRIIETAERTAGAQLKILADTGDGHAQYSYYIILRYGVQPDTPADYRAADAYRAKAIADRGFRATAIYVPGTKKTAGHTMLVNMPQYDVTTAEVQVVDACLAVLSQAVSPEGRVSEGVCGGPENFRRLQSQWRQTEPPIREVQPPIPVAPNSAN